MRYINYTTCSLILLTLFIACKEQTNGNYPKRMDLTESVYSSVIIEPDSFYQVNSTARGIVEEIFIEEGELIQKGDEILRIVNYNTSLTQKNSKLELELAAENYDGESNVLKDLENELDIAKLSLVNDSNNFERQKRLWLKQIGSKNDFETKELLYLNSQKKVQSIKTQIARKKKELEVTLTKAKNNYDNSLSKNSEFIVKSRIKGKLYDLLKKEGESVNEQEAIAFIGSELKFTIRMQVDEVDIVKLKVGQQIWVSLDAYTDQVFEATLKKIIPRMDQETQTFWVEGAFKNPPSVLYSGLRGEANIVISKSQSTLTIPSEFLLDDNKVITKKETLTVQTGIRSIDRIEVLSGLDTNTVIYKP